MTGISFLALSLSAGAAPKPRVAKGTVQPLEEVEKEHIIAVLTLNNGNQTHTARLLQISLTTLYRRLKSYGLIAGEVESQKEPTEGEGSFLAVPGPRA